MEIKYPKNFSQSATGRYGIRRDHIENAILNKDQVQVLEIDTLRLALFLKRISLSSGDHMLLVLTTEEGKEVHVDSAFRIYDDFQESIYGRSPLELLELVVERFGYDVRIGDQSQKFFLNAEVEIPKGQERNFLAVEEMSGETTFTSFIKTESVGGVSVAKCAMAYCISDSKYIDWLKSFR